MALGVANFSGVTARADLVIGPQLFDKIIGNNDVNYDFKDGVLTVTGTGIADNTYTCKESEITKLIVKDGIKGISDSAFSNCSNLKAIVLPNTIVDIGIRAFDGIGATEITIPSSVKRIGEDFVRGKNLKSITMPGDFEAVRETDDGIGLVLYSKVSTINLNSPYSPDNKRQFLSKKINTMKNDPKYKSYNGVVYDKKGKTLVQVPVVTKNIKTRKGCSRIDMSSVLYSYYPEDEEVKQVHPKTFTIGKNIKKVVNDLKGKRTHFDNKVKITVKSKKLTGLSIENVSSMMTKKQVKKFWKTKNAKVKTKNDFKITKGNVILKYTGKKKTVKIPSKTKRIGRECFKSNKTIKKVVFNKKLKSIGDEAFYECRNLKKVTWSKKIKKVGRWCFDDDKLEKLVMPKSVTYWGEGCFHNNNIKKIVFSKTIKSIPDWSFSSIKVKNLVIPGHIKHIGKYAFIDAKSQTITLEEGVETIDSSAFGGSRKLDKVVIPSTIRSIGYAAFSDTKIDELVLKNIDAEIGEYAFTYAKLIDCGDDPSKYSTLAGLCSSNINGECEIGFIQVKNGTGIELQIDTSEKFDNPTEFNVENKTQTKKFNRPNDDYKYYRVRVYTNTAQGKVYGPWREFNWNRNY